MTLRYLYIHTKRNRSLTLIKMKVNGSVVPEGYTLAKRIRVKRC